MNASLSECSQDDIQLIENGIIEFNRFQAPYTQNPPVIYLNYKIEEQEEFIAGIKSILYCWGCCFVEYLFVKEGFRKKGHGTQLLKKVETEAKIKGCYLVHLDTFDFQAKDFYLKHGYEEFGVLRDCPKGHERYFLKKRI